MTALQSYEKLGVFYLGRYHDLAARKTLTDLDKQFQAEAGAIESGGDPAAESFETIELRPNKTNISVKIVALAWTPHTRDDTAS